jgi:hypothetical protein
MTSVILKMSVSLDRFHRTLTIEPVSTAAFSGGADAR